MSTKSWTITSYNECNLPTPKLLTHPEHHTILHMRDLLE